MNYQEIKQSLKDRELEEFDMRMAGVMAANMAIGPLVHEVKRKNAHCLAKAALVRCVATILKHRAIGQIWNGEIQPIDPELNEAVALCADCMENEWPFRLL